MFQNGSMVSGQSTRKPGKQVDLGRRVGFSF